MCPTQLKSAPDKAVRHAPYQRTVRAKQLYRRDKRRKSDRGAHMWPAEFKVERLTWLVALVATVLLPAVATADIAVSPGSDLEDLAAFGLIAPGVVTTAYLTQSLRAGKTSNARGCLGVGVGATLLAFGLNESTSVSPAVDLAGAVTFGLGLAHWALVRKDAESAQSPETDAGQTHVQPVLLGYGKGKSAIGIGVRGSF